MNWYKKAKQKELPQQKKYPQIDRSKYKTLKDFQKDYELLYHGGSKDIVGDKLMTGGRTVDPVTKENLGKGQDYGGIFFTPDKQFADIFKHKAPGGGEGKTHSFLVQTSDLFDQTNPKHTQRLKNFIGQKYRDVDGEEQVFDEQMYNFIFPLLQDKKRYMDWATFDPNILHAMGFKGAKVIENYDIDGKGTPLYSTVLFEGGENSPHWKVDDNVRLEDIYKGN